MAEVYAFLKLDGIDGESQDSDYKNMIELHSFSWGASNNSSFASGTGSGIGKGQIQDIQCSKFTDKASLLLMQKCVTGGVISSGKVSLLKLSGDTKVAYLELELSKIVVTSFHVGASGNGELPVESFALSFVEVKSHYKPQQNTGSAEGPVDFGRSSLQIRVG